MITFAKQEEKQIFEEETKIETRKRGSIVNFSCIPSFSSSNNYLSNSSESMFQYDSRNSDEDDDVEHNEPVDVKHIQSPNRITAEMLESRQSIYSAPSGRLLSTSHNHALNSNEYRHSCRNISSTDSDFHIESPPKIDSEMKKSDVNYFRNATAKLGLLRMSSRIDKNQDLRQESELIEDPIIVEERTYHGKL